MPIPDTLLACASAQLTMEQVCQIDILEYILSCLGRGDVEKIYHDTEYPNGSFDVSVKVDGGWYRLHIQILPTGGACA